MPGAKRRLKKAANGASPGPSSDTTTESGTPPTGGTAPALEPTAFSTPPSEHHHSMHIPFMPRKKDSSPAHNEISSSPDRHYSKSPSLLDEILHPISSRRSRDQSRTSLDRTGSIASDKNNYMSDEALAEDLEVEQQMEQQMEQKMEQQIGQRQGSMGGQQPHVDDGVADLPNRMGAMLPPSRDGVNGHVPDSKHTSGSSTPSTPDQYTLGPGNTVVPPPRGANQYTADQLIAGPQKGKKKSSKQRFAERQARKKHAYLDSLPPADPSWTATLVQERDEEIQVITEACDILGREIHEIAPDGHCMFNAIADQLYCLGMVDKDNIGDPRWMRNEAAQYMLKHPDDFMPFLPSITGEDSEGATEHDGMMTDKEFKKYCKLVAETGEWGGEPEIQALSRRFMIPVHVIQRGPPTVVSHGGVDDDFGGVLTPQKSAAQGDRVIRISYHKRMYGLGEHYNSLRKAAA